MIKLIENDITVEEYQGLRESVGWRRLSDRQAQAAIDNSLFFIKAIGDRGTPIGMGRIVGDGAVICYIQDLVVSPTVQGMGVGTKLINRLKEFVESLREDNTTMMLCLMCAKGREEFYLKNGFTARPTDNLGPGMITYLM
ncbi:MAG: GNAT family N-acetyltransferase [Lachnospiraceae bacterium]|nr:GNAT family N-acetyltransferase [Lachnospiraceae bacterium]